MFLQYPIWSLNKEVCVCLCPRFKYCLVYLTLVFTDQSGESIFDGVWAIDLSLQLHRICDTFSEYLRLAIVHLGLPEWQGLLLPLNQLSSPNAVSCV